MLQSFLPKTISDALKHVNLTCVSEIRLRVSRPIIVVANGQFFFLCEDGLSGYSSKAIKATKTMLSDIVFRAAECSIYSSNDQIKKGFLCVGDGVRIGIGGEVVVENNQIKTIKNYTSLCIRIPHNISGCSLNMFYDVVKNKKVLNTLIISPPGCGKTTLLRDFINQLFLNNCPQNIFVADERCEIAGDSKEGFGLIENTYVDVVSNLCKHDAILQGIRVLSPTLIITDEISSSEDAKVLAWAMNSGVAVVATIHGAGVEDIMKKEDFAPLFEKKYFQRFVVLSDENGPGTFRGIYDKDLERISRRR